MVSFIHINLFIHKIKVFFDKVNINLILYWKMILVYLLTLEAYWSCKDTINSLQQALSSAEKQDNKDKIQ